MYVEVKGKSVEKALSLFKKRVKNANLMKQIRDNEFYEKPSAKRRRKRNSVKHRRKYSNNDQFSFLNYTYIYNSNTPFK